MRPPARAPTALLAVVALALAALPPSASTAGSPVAGTVEGAGWWAARVALAGNEGFPVEARVEGVLADPDRGAVLVALLDATGARVGAWSLLGNDETVGGSATAVVIEPVRIDLPDLSGAAPGVTVVARLTFPVPAAEYTLVLAAAAETGAVRATVRAPTGTVSLLADTRGDEAYVLGESAFQCFAGTTLGTPPGARASAMLACHRQVQLHASLVSVYRVKPGGGPPPEFSIVDPVGNPFEPESGKVTVANGGPGVWEYLLDGHAGAGVGIEAPDVAALIADVAMP